MVKILSIALFVITLMGINRMISAQTRCRNPNSRNGYCISIKECPTLTDVIKRQPLSNDDRQFLLQSQCVNGYGKPPYVCCTEDTGFANQGPVTVPTPPVVLPPSPSNGQANKLPNPPNCGTEPTSNKIYNGNDTLLDEFPWMVLLEYRTREGRKILNCGGSLINQRYVLTAAHCVTGKILAEIGQLVTVRLGEYDISKTLDCIEANDCADPIVEVGIEEAIPHENYVDTSNNHHNDIALIRMNRDVRYSDFIRPVCLPSTLNFQRSAVGEDVTVAGWGRTLLIRQSAIKQKLVIPISNHQQCVQKFGSKNVNIIDSQLCAGGGFAQDSCDGDSGGPLMKFTNQFWAIEGIVSFGNGCGLEGWPGIYTRVSSFDSWIKRNLRP